jgi:hypothetical protein
VSRAQPSLRALQRRFARAIRRPDAVRWPGAPARWRVYAEAYEARLVGVLADDYPATRAWLSPERFAALAARYLRECPSRHPNLNRLGERFPAFLRRRHDVADFARHLARLELAITCAFDAPAAQALPTVLPGPLPAITLRTRLRVHPSVRLLRLPGAVVDHFEAWREGRIPTVAADRSTSPVVDLLVVRTSQQVLHRRLPRTAAAVLRALQRGRPLGQALDKVAASAPVADWFARWRAAGVFAAAGAFSRSTP